MFYYSISIMCTRYETGPLLHHKHIHGLWFNDTVLRLRNFGGRACATVLGTSTRPSVSPGPSEPVIKIKKNLPPGRYIKTERIACDRVETFYNRTHEHVIKMVRARMYVGRCRDTRARVYLCDATIFRR